MGTFDLTSLLDRQRILDLIPLSTNSSHNFGPQKLKIAR